MLFVDGDAITGALTTSVRDGLLFPVSVTFAAPASRQKAWTREEAIIELITPYRFSTPRTFMCGPRWRPPDKGYYQMETGEMDVLE